MKGCDGLLEIRSCLGPFALRCQISQRIAQIVLCQRPKFRKCLPFVNFKDEVVGVNRRSSMLAHFCTFRTRNQLPL